MSFIIGVLLNIKNKKIWINIHVVNGFILY